MQFSPFERVYLNEYTITEVETSFVYNFYTNEWEVRNGDTLEWTTMSLVCSNDTSLSFNCGDTQIKAGYDQAATSFGLYVDMNEAKGEVIPVFVREGGYDWEPIYTRSFRGGA